MITADRPSRMQQRIGALVVVIALPFLSILGMAGGSVERDLRAWREAPVLPLTTVLIKLSQAVNYFWYLGFALLVAVYFFWVCRSRDRTLWFNAAMCLLLPAILVAYAIGCVDQIEEIRKYAQSHPDLRTR